MKTATEQPPRAEGDRAVTMLIGWLVLATAAIIFLFVAGVAGIALVWLARAALG